MGFLGKTIKRYLSSSNTNRSRDEEEGKHFYRVDYKRLKSILKNCSITNKDVKVKIRSNCQYCEETFLVELRKEAYEVERCFRNRVKAVVGLHTTSLRRYFLNDLRGIAKECSRLMQYAAANAADMRKILDKYDQIHNTMGGSRNSESAKNINILQSPWLKELGALYVNLKDSNGGAKCKDIFSGLYCDLNPTGPVMTMKLSNSIQLEHTLSCPICLDIVFHPNALGCGHIFCKECACAAASVAIADGLKAATHHSKCPICRQEGVYVEAEPMKELSLLLKKRNKKYWRDRRAAESKEQLKQSMAKHATPYLFIF